MAEATGGTRGWTLAQAIFGSASSDVVAVPPPSIVMSSATAGRQISIEDAANIFKALGHDGRLLILCHLLAGEKSVTELESILDARQSAVSQQLARLRMEGMVSARREGQTIYYSLRDPRIRQLLTVFGTIFACHALEDR